MDDVLSNSDQTAYTKALQPVQVPDLADKMLAAMELDALMTERLQKMVRDIFLTAEKVKNFKQVSTSNELINFLKQKVDYNKEAEAYKKMTRAAIDALKADRNLASQDYMQKTAFAQVIHIDKMLHFMNVIKVQLMIMEAKSGGQIVSISSFKKLKSIHTGLDQLLRNLKNRKSRTAKNLLNKQLEKGTK